MYGLSDMKRKIATRGKCVAFPMKVRQGSKVLIPQGDVKYLFDESKTQIKKYAIRSPLTHEWMEFDVPVDYIAAGCFPKECNDLIDYYESMTCILELGRDVQPMKNDLTPWDDEECKLFGLRDPRKYIRVKC